MKGAWDMRVLATATALTLAATGFVGGAQSASADITKCDPGSTWSVVGKPHKSWIIKQHDVKENYTGAPRVITFTVSRTSSVTDSVSANAEVSGSVKAGVFASFEAKVGTEVGRIGQETRFSSYSDQVTLKSGDTYHFARGTRKWASSWERRHCNSRGSDWSVVARGKVRGYLSVRDTVVGCEKNTDVGTLARAVKRRYC